VRLEEANALLSLGFYDGAYYLAGYAVECALKACIAKGTLRYEFPDKKKVESSYSHNLRDLIKVAGLRKPVSSELPKTRTFERTGISLRHGRSRAGTNGIGRKPHAHCSRRLVTAAMELCHG
jgi:HEPN domain